MRRHHHFPKIKYGSFSHGLCTKKDMGSAIIDAAMKYYDKTQFGRDRTPGDPQRFHNVNSLVWRCGAAGVRSLPVLTAHDISLPEQ